MEPLSSNIAVDVESLLGCPIQITVEDAKSLPVPDKYQYYYPVGNCPSGDVTHGCCIPNPCNILLLGCGDVRFFLHTLDALHGRLHNTEPKPTLNFHLNDIEEGILARALITLYLVDTIDVDNLNDLKFLWAVWYDVLLSKTHMTRLKRVMKDLEMVSSGDHGVRFGSPRTQEKVVQALKCWGGKKFHPEGVISERKDFNFSGYSTDQYPQTPTRRVGSRFTEQHEMFSDKKLSQRLHEEICEYVLGGVTRVNLGSRNMPELLKSFHVNPTFYRPQETAWKVQDNCSPFMCYNVDYKLERYGSTTISMSALFLETLRKWVQTYQRIRRDGWNLNIHLWLGHCADVCSDDLPETLKFDFIHTGNTADYVGIIPMLVTCVSRLKRDNGVVAIESYHSSQSFSIVPDTLNMCVNIPLTMYPTIIGLQLAEDLNLGHERPLESGFFVGCGRLILNWKAAPEPSKLTLTGSDEVSKCLRAIIRPNTDSKATMGPMKFKGAHFTLIDTPSVIRLVKRLAQYVEGGGQQVAKIIEGFLMGQLPASFGFLKAPANATVDTGMEALSVSDQKSITEYMDRYEVKVNASLDQMKGKFTCDYSSDNHFAIVYTFEDSGTVVFQTEINFSCAVSLNTSKTQLSRKRSFITSTFFKDEELAFGDRILTKQALSCADVTRLPEFPDSTFGRQLIHTYLYRIYPINKKKSILELDNPKVGHQLQGVIQFLMQSVAKNRSRTKVLGIPMLRYSPDEIYKWAGVFHVEGMKVWEEKLTLFVTWYDFEKAWTLLKAGRITRVNEGYQLLARILRLNSSRLQQEESDQVSWKVRTYVRPRFNYLSFRILVNEVNLSAKYGDFPADPEDAKRQIHRMLSDMDSKGSSKEKVDDLYNELKKHSPGYSGYSKTGTPQPEHHSDRQSLQQLWKSI
ncbi:uncharacterized protein LOC124262721 [Haliotis rubra]|uniref:uncharacterized protein LOC124262721 n=1 Tax=Haliotis rubra TaxID=36100 RepID=UPI001EE5622D|nr:uncharacterized protein LOC124262721 [Haliotis rubra]